MSFVQSPLFGVTLTVIAYVAANRIYRHVRWLHPLFVTSGSLIVLLWLADIPYEAYRVGGDILTFLLGPATVALAVPLYKQFYKIRQHWRPIFLGIAAGSVTGLVMAAGLVFLFGGTRVLMLTMMPKSVTTPIAIEIVRSLGGIPELGAVFTVLTGLLGSMFGPAILRVCRVHHEIARGVAMGTAAHGIGTARVLQDSEVEGSFSGFAMGFAGIIVSFLTIPL